MKQRRHKFCGALIAFVLCAVVPASARGIDLSVVTCIESVDAVEPERWWIPVGCEAVLCCQGCPDASVDWRIQVSGAPLEGFSLRFENLPADVARRLKIKGKARWEGNSLRVWKGETIISGFKNAPRSVPPVATPRLRLDRDTLRRLQEDAARAGGAAQAGQAAGPTADRSVARMEVVVEQLVGEYVVNEARLSYNLRTCPAPPSTTDHIDINNNDGSDSAIVLLDGRDGGSGRCVDDQDWRGTDNIFLGSVLSNGGCNSEVAIFSDDNAMAFLTPVTSWTDAMPDKLTVSLAPRLEAPVAIWIVTDESGVPERAEWELATANVLYNNNNVGIEFAAAPESIFNHDGIGILDKLCNNAPLIRASKFYKPGQINVYYIDNWTVGWKGHTCWQTDPNSTSHEPNIIFINRWSNVETLAHELAHAFSLEESDFPGVAGLTTDNIMWRGGANRTIFTVGQAFRMNVNSTSMLNVNGVRTGPVRDPPCSDVDAATSNICPRLSRDVTPK